MHAIHKREKNQKNIQSEPFCIEAFELELEGGGNVRGSAGGLEAKRSTQA